MDRQSSARRTKRRRIGRRSQPDVAFAISITTTLIFPKSRRIRAIIFRRSSRWRKALVRLDGKRLSRRRLPTKCNIAGVNCAAFRQARVGELSHWKGVAFANAARHGVYAALLARAGMTGPAPIFEGAMGFEKELGVSLGNVREVFDKTKEAMPGEGPASMILKTSIKYWPAEYHSQSAIEAALFLRNQISDLSQVKSMVIESHDASVDIIGS